MTALQARAETRRLLFVLGSTRRDGNSEILARHAAQALDSSVEQRWVRLLDLGLPEFVDRRHAGPDGRDITPEPSGVEAMLAEETLAATDLVIVSPLYWYSVSASVKSYLDHWSGWARLAEMRFMERMRGKRLWLISALADEPEKADAVVGMLRRCADQTGMHFAGALLGNSSAPGQVCSDEAAMTRAVGFLSLQDRSELVS